MDGNYKFGRNEGISLEQSPLSIILKYSDIDHRIIDHYHFRIPLSSLPLTLKTINEKVDLFPGASEMLTHKVLWEDVPEQVISDALNWLNNNITVAKDNGKGNIESILISFKEKIIKEYFR